MPSPMTVRFPRAIHCRGRSPHHTRFCTPLGEGMRFQGTPLGRQRGRSSQRHTESRLRTPGMGTRVSRLTCRNSFQLPVCITIHGMKERRCQAGDLMPMTSCCPLKPARLFEAIRGIQLLQWPAMYFHQTPPTRRTLMLDACTNLRLWGCYSPA